MAADPFSAETLTGDASLALSEFAEPPADPIGLLRGWVDAARKREVSEPMAMALSTASAGGTPSSRIVLVKRIDETGLRFGTADRSRKGRDFAANPKVAGTFYWRETLQQINVSGEIELLGEEDSDCLLYTSPSPRDGLLSRMPSSA